MVKAEPHLVTLTDWRIWRYRAIRMGSFVMFKFVI